MIGLHWLQLFLLLVFLVILSKPLGLYLACVLNPHRKTWLDPLLKPLEKATYRLLGVSIEREQTWKEYLFSILLFSFASFLFTYLILIFQDFLPLNPQNLPGLPHDLAFNTSVSYLTNTNWQSYAAEKTMSYFSQMTALTVQNFLSPAVGMGVASTLIRAFARNAMTTIGNFWVDLIRLSYYFFLPLAIVVAILFLSQGTPQNFQPYRTCHSIESGMQTIVQGPIASQEAIKILGTNGGGYTSTSSAHPYENPSPLSNFLQILFILAIPAGQIYYFGRVTNHQKHGWSIFITMALLFIIGAIIVAHSEATGNLLWETLGITSSSGNMEGKEMRFGIFSSALFSTTSTAASNGAVNSSLDSYTPLGGMIPLLNIQLGEIIFGGIGSGLYSMILFIILSVFIAGLIIGRTPEYLGKKIEGFDIKMAVFALLMFIFSILGFTSLFTCCSFGREAVSIGGPHGFSQILYAFSSATGNNGSGFCSIEANTAVYNINLAIAMLLGRFFCIFPVLALAGSFVQKKKLPQGKGSFPVSGMTFILLLIGVILLINALTFTPALIMGPILEKFFLHSQSFFW